MSNYTIIHILKDTEDNQIASLPLVDTPVGIIDLSDIELEGINGGYSRPTTFHTGYCPSGCFGPCDPDDDQPGWPIPVGK